MNWDDLKVFLAAARLQRFELAARQLKLDPSTVGRRIARLEHAVGATLFEHSSSGLIATEAGRRLLEHAEGMEHHAIGVAGQPSGRSGALTGTVRVSVSEAFGTWILARHLSDFTSKHRGLTVDLVASGGFLSPSKREADVAIMLARPALGPLITRRLANYRLGLYGARSYIARRGEPKALQELSSHDIVGFVPDLIQVPQQRLLEEIAAGLVATVRSTSINAQVALVSAGAGIGVLPAFIGDSLEGVDAILPAEVNLSRTFWLVVHKDVRKLARIDAFVTWLLELFRRESRLIAGESR